MQADLLLTLLLYALGALFWRNPRRSIPRALGLIRRNVYSGGLLLFFPLFSGVLWTAATILAARGIGGL